METKSEASGRDLRDPVLLSLLPRFSSVSSAGHSAESSLVPEPSRGSLQRSLRGARLHSVDPLDRGVCTPGIRSTANARGDVPPFSTVTSAFYRASFSFFRPPVLSLFPASSGVAFCSSELPNVSPKAVPSTSPRANPSSCPVSRPTVTSAGQGCPFGHGKSERAASDLVPAGPSDVSTDSSSSGTANAVSCPASVFGSVCPVEHGSSGASLSGNSAELPQECPMKRLPVRKSFFSSLFSSSPAPSSCPYGLGEGGENAQGVQVEVPAGLSDAREKSTIPSVSGENWNYPSEKQFYRVTRAKGHQVDPGDMPAIVAIHNAVNEQTWTEILRFEAFHQRECDTPKLVRFVGRPEELTFKARIKHFLGYERPFDRHDWLVDRCGTKVRYLIDFYDGRAPPEEEARGKVAIYIDARPDVLSPHGLRDRVRMFLTKKGWLQR
ncbi:putative cytochrome c heme lyase [Neospora caninum Liverpool]|uniref:Holocytochrome c-type synthase n=1 Tax=Neospora caninum (strain Liverpool) TaxID=572307 RepID=F0VNK4_NEOCL|nr:putative cytochrome c heme lyase [Neospora caninum Liverpool]CBZ55300.1 putative cytochrome c heme lyase [Neospora caninum Liverpool]CEL70032.1 TPA: cytochrome c heme lyase, putative [Neospora caninum Liverpool]|eukprot:XP_003885328.1 putative cytochrome c heme lyase [Neospora caninum Liverpool]